MKFENISTEEDFRLGRIRMAVLWEKEDVGRFSDFFKQDMVDVVQIIGDGGVLGALVSPQLPSVEASTYEHTCDGYPYSDANLNCLACKHDVKISAIELRQRLEQEMENESRIGESYAVVALRGAIMIVDELAGWKSPDHPPQTGDADG
jgi:hypothetical protein